MKTILVTLTLLIASTAFASVTIDGEKYLCQNGNNDRMKVKVSFNSLRPNDHIILKGEKVNGKTAYESRVLGFNVELNKQNTDKITLVDTQESNIEKAVYSCRHL